MALEITGVRKPDRTNYHEAISHYRWFDDSDNTTGTNERVALIGWMQENEVDAYVLDGARKVWCGIRKNQHGTIYLQTYADKKWANNLLALPPC